MKTDCCYGCPKRAPGCHDPKTCPAWAEHVAASAEEYADRVIEYSAKVTPSWTQMSMGTGEKRRRTRRK